MYKNLNLQLPNLNFFPNFSIKSLDKFSYFLTLNLCFAYVTYFVNKFLYIKTLDSKEKLTNPY